MKNIKDWTRDWQPEKASITVAGSFNSAAEMHVRNFLDCVRARKKPNAPVEKVFRPSW
jgi:hypothetical protein